MSAVLARRGSSKSKLVVAAVASDSLPGGLGASEEKPTATYAFDNIFTALLPLQKSALYDALPSLYAPSLSGTTRSKRRKQLRAVQIEEGDGDSQGEATISDGLLDMEKVSTFLQAQIDDMGTLRQGFSLLHKYVWRGMQQRQRVCSSTPHLLPVLLSSISAHWQEKEVGFMEDCCGLICVMLSPLSTSTSQADMEGEGRGGGQGKPMLEWPHSTLRSCQSLAEALPFYQEVDDIVEDLCSALAELSHAREVRAFFIEARMFDYSATMPRLAGQSETSDTPLPKTGVAECAVSTLRRHLNHAGVCEECLGWLANLLSDESDGKTVALRSVEAGLAGVLVSILTTHNDKAEVARRAAGVVANTLLSMHEILLMQLDDDEAAADAASADISSLLPELDFVERGGIEAMLGTLATAFMAKEEEKKAAARDLRDGCLSALLQLLFTSQVMPGNDAAMRGKLLAGRSALAIAMRSAGTLSTILSYVSPHCDDADSVSLLLDVLYSYLCLEDALAADAEGHGVLEDAEGARGGGELVAADDMEDLLEFMLRVVETSEDVLTPELCAVLRRLPALRVLQACDGSVVAAMEEYEQYVLGDEPKREEVMHSLGEVLSAVASCPLPPSSSQK